MQNIPEKIVPLYSKIPNKIVKQEAKESRSLKLFENAISLTTLGRIIVAP